jgi:hypothetical protein
MNGRTFSKLTSIAVALGAWIVMGGVGDTAEAATFTIINADGAGEGFNDNTPAVPVGDNPGTTVGEQRLIAFQYAADLWGARIESNIDIRVQASFDELQCNSFGAVLGAAGPKVINRDFTGAPLQNTWYPPSLANILAGADINPGTEEIVAFFNSRLGQPDCLAGTFFYYGLDGNEGLNIDFVTVLTHELGHGLGFLSLNDPSTGQELSGFPDIFSNFLEDHSTGKLFPDMTDFERAVASVDGTHCRRVSHRRSSLERPLADVRAEPGRARVLGVALGESHDAKSDDGTVIHGGAAQHRSRARAVLGSRLSADLPVWRRHAGRFADGV